MPVASSASWGFPIERILENFPCWERSYQAVECFLYHLEREKYLTKGNIQAYFPCLSMFPTFTACRHVVKTHLCLLLPVPLLQNTRVFPVAAKLSASCAISSGRWKESGRGRGKCLANRQGAGTYSIFFNSNKRVTPCRGGVLLPMIVQCCGNAHPYWIH